MPQVVAERLCIDGRMAGRMAAHTVTVGDGEARGDPVCECPAVLPTHPHT